MLLPIAEVAAHRKCCCPPRKLLPTANVAAHRGCCCPPGTEKNFAVPPGGTSYLLPLTKFLSAMDPDLSRIINQDLRLLTCASSSVPFISANTEGLKPGIKTVFPVRRVFQPSGWWTSLPPRYNTIRWLTVRRQNERHDLGMCIFLGSHSNPLEE